MKKFISILATFAICTAYTGCNENECLWDAYYDLDGRVSALEQSVADANSDIAALQKLVKALQEKVTIDAVTPTATGYSIKFSDGTSAEISNGVSAAIPYISVAKDTDGLYYWTLDGEWMTDDNTGAKVRASAIDGDKGTDGITPQIRINEQTKEWEISVDEGATWQSTGVVAEGKNGQGGTECESFFKSVNTSDNEYVVFTLADDSEIVIPRTIKIRFEIACDAELNVIKFGSEKSFAVTAEGVAEYMISRPDGWSASYDGASLKVKAPAEENINAEMSGEVAVMVVSANGTSKIAKMRVEAVPYELRVLTFEDSDYKGSENAGYWSSLIDTKEYNGDLLYSGDEYTWFDEDNTNLYSGLADFYGDYMFWYGGCVVSDYTLSDIMQGDFTTQLSVYAPAGGNGGHNGSANFGIAFDGSSMMGSPTAQLLFYDGVERKIDHMYINSTAYLLHSMVYGDGFAKPLGDDGWFAVTATGYDTDEEETGSTTIYLGKDGNTVDEWTKWDLSSLGKVLYVEFKCTGSDMGAYGLNTPSYFAFDDIAVRFED